MKSRKGFTLIELLVVIALAIILIVSIGGCILVVNTVGTSIDDAETAERLLSNPPLYKSGDVVFHKATDARMIVANPSYSWNDVKLGWNMKVSDGGNWDQVGGKTINETEVKRTLKTVGR